MPELWQALEVFVRGCVTRGYQYGKRPDLRVDVRLEYRGEWQNGMEKDASLSIPLMTLERTAYLE